jgi:hypothetical protein
MLALGPLLLLLNLSHLAYATRACSGAKTLDLGTSMHLLAVYFFVLLVRFGVSRN